MPGQPLDTMTGFTRFFQEIRLQETYLYDQGNRRVSFNDIETSATFAIPPGWSTNPILLTPGFGLWLWDGPPSEGSEGADLPGQTYSAYLDTAWNPQFSPYFGADLGVRVGVYTDFDTINTESLRVMGRGLAVINYSPTVQLKLGVVYLDRIHIKLFPAGGVPSGRPIRIPAGRFTSRARSTRIASQRPARINCGGT